MTPALGFKARGIRCLCALSPVSNVFVRLTSSAKRADFLMVSMAANPFLIHIPVHGNWWTQTRDRVCRRTVCLTGALPNKRCWLVIGDPFWHVNLLCPTRPTEFHCKKHQVSIKMQ